MQETFNEHLEELSCSSHVCLFVTLWATAHEVPLPIGFSRQEYQRGLLCPPPMDPPGLGIEPASYYVCALAGRFFTTDATWLLSWLST